VAYKTLMVHAQLRQSNDGLFKIATDLARRLEAAVIGVAAYRPMQIPQGDIYVLPDLIEQDRVQIKQEMTVLEASFRTAFAGHGGALEWRAAVTLASLAGYLADQGRSADLIVTGIERDSSLFDTSRQVNIVDLVMQAGRPVLIVPPATATLKLERVVVAWKDTREARRAILDALPLLKRAAHVAVIEIAAESELPAARARLGEVTGWLKRHGIAAEPTASPAAGDDATLLQHILKDREADLVVAGAYGHSRLREWAFGGVTRDLLLRANRCLLVSH
jgi:nucleotide-binding universal stress UspA family protein